MKSKKPQDLRVEKIFGNRPQWQKEIIAECPDIFIGRTNITGKTTVRDVPNLLLGFGFECGPGWAGILRAFAKYCKNYLENEPTAIVQIDQIKEKFGMLRIYLGGPMEIQNAASFAEYVSGEVCEQCGAPGRPNDSGWISTLCDPCRKKRMAGK